MKNSVNKIVIISLLAVILASAALLAAFVVVPMIKGGGRSNEGAPSGECLISVNTEGLELDSESGAYVIREKLERLSGTLEDGNGADTIECTVIRVDGIPVMNEAFAADENWSTDSVFLAYGVNLIKVRASSGDETLASAELKVVNLCTDEYESCADADTDTDGDGLFDVFELMYSFTSPVSADTDGNGRSDGDEDADGDGLANFEEMALGTLPLVPDTDTDGLGDGEEAQLGTDPFDADTDDDGIEDKVELEFGHDPAVEDDAERIGTYTIGDIAVGDAFDLTVALQVSPSVIGKVKITGLPYTSVLSPERIEGMTGCAIVFNVDGEVEKGKVTLTINDAYYDEAADYALYYVNEDTLMFERVSSQKNTDNVITADITRFAVFAVLEEPQDDFRSFAQYFEDPFADPGDVDSDKDGFADSEDDTPYFAKTFKTFSDYLGYVFPEKDVVTVMVELPGGMQYPVKLGEMYTAEDGTPLIDMGHAWITYTDGEGTETVGFEPAGGSLSPLGGAQSGIIVRDEADSASIMLPIEVDPSAKAKLEKFIEGFDKDYDLYAYNDATFVTELLEAIGVELDVPSYISGLTADGGMMSLFKDAKSPAHLAYYMLSDRADDCVVRKDGGYNSKYTDDRAVFTDSDTVSEVLKYTSSDKAQWNGHTYQLFNTSMTWTDAKAYCESLGGHLVTISSAEEQAVLEKLMESGTKKQYWIGLDRDTGWVTDEDIDYSNWDVGEPNACRRRGLKERYAHILNVPNPVKSSSKRFKWNDMFNDNTFPGEEGNFSLNTVGVICEWESAE